MRRAPLVAVLLAAAVSAGCGTTVPAGSPVAGTEAEPLGSLPGTVTPQGVRPSATGPLATQAPATEAAVAAQGAPGAGQVVAPGRTAANRAPLRVGITYAETASTFAALGASGDPVNGKSTAQAFVRAVNAAGGLRGRKLEPVYFGWDTSSGNYSADAAAACEAFTEDHHVEVVLDSVFGTAGGFGRCLQGRGVLHLTSTTEGDRSSSQQRSLHANTHVMDDDRTYGAVVTHLAGTGYLGKANRLGVLIEQCPNEQAAYSRTVAPLVRRLGLRPAVVRQVECTTGFTSAGPASAAVSAAVLAFRDADVDRVMLMSDYETVALLLFANAASSQGYRPGYLLSSNAQAEATRGSLPEDQWPQLRGVGGSVAGDVSMQGIRASAVEARCLALVRAGGLAPATQNDHAYVYRQCGLLLLLETALEHTAGISRPQVLMNAITSLGMAFTAPGIVAGATRFAPGHLDGPRAVRVFGYDGTCQCLRYKGKALPVAN